MDSKTHHASYALLGTLLPPYLNPNGQQMSRAGTGVAVIPAANGSPCSARASRNYQTVPIYRAATHRRYCWDPTASPRHAVVKDWPSLFRYEDIPVNLAVTCSEQRIRYALDYRKESGSIRRESLCKMAADHVLPNYLLLSYEVYGIINIHSVSTKVHIKQEVER